MALSGRQTAGAALAGAPEAGAAARIARCSHSHETLHRSRVTVPPRDRPGVESSLAEKDYEQEYKTVRDATPDAS